MKLICHFTGKDLVKLNLVKLKNILKMFFNMDDCFYSFGADGKKTKRKEKKKQCVMFVANSVREETRSRIV